MSIIFIKFISFDFDTDSQANPRIRIDMFQRIMQIFRCEFDLNIISLPQEDEDIMKLKRAVQLQLPILSKIYKFFNIKEERQATITAILETPFIILSSIFPRWYKGGDNVKRIEGYGLKRL